MIFPMDSFNGKSDGEDLFYEKMNEFLPKNFVSFHNQDIGMEEADVFMLVDNGCNNVSSACAALVQETLCQSHSAQRSANDDSHEALVFS